MIDLPNARTSRLAGWRLWTSADAPSDLSATEVLAALRTGTGIETVLKVSRRSRVVRLELLERSLVVKTFRNATPWERWKSRLARSSAFREWRGAALWEALGARAAAPWILLSNVFEDHLVGPFLEGVTLQSALQRPETCDVPDEVRRRLARAMGRQMGRAATGGVINRDHKPTNVMLDARALRGAAPVLLDLAGVRHRRGRGAVLSMVQSLARVAMRPDFVRRPGEVAAFLRGFLEECPNVGGSSALRVGVFAAMLSEGRGPTASSSDT